MQEAASIPLVGLTAWQALIEKAKLKKGQKVFIQAGSGGVGTFAIQLAKHVGALVAATTSGANVDSRCRDHRLPLDKQIVAYTIKSGGMKWEPSICKR